jgi:hypothetical protein
MSLENSMKTGTVSARRMLVKAVQETIIPVIKSHGFLDIKSTESSPPNWSFHRKRSNGDFDLLDIWFDEGFKPSFMCYINTIPKQGITQPWGEYVAANQAIAITPLKRVMVMHRNKGLIAWLLARWFSHGPFSFKPNKDKSINIERSKSTCIEFLKCLGQAEDWWKCQMTGPNIIKADLSEGWNPGRRGNF